jgi:quinoprotein glucose dehydrogenase
MRFAVALVLVTSAHCAPQAEPITPANVSRLRVAWTYDSKEPIAEFRKQPRFEATPVYADGKLYLSTPGGFVVALDAESGREIWKTDLHVDRKRDYSDFANRGVTLAGDTIFVGTADARLISIDRTTGKLRPGFGKEGEVELTAGLRRKPLYLGEYGVSSPPAFYRDLIIVGAFVADNSRAKMSSGEVRAFDAKSGALRWTFHPLPEESPAGAANTWSRIVVDEPNGLVFLPTGSASPDYYGGLRPGDNRDANSIVVLKAATGEKVWSFQTVHHDLWDYDVASPPLLFPGKNGPAVAVGSKTAHLFLFDRLTGKPFFPIEERPVPKSDAPGEQAWPTQPFPTLPLPLAPQQITEKDIFGSTPEDLKACRDLFHSLRNDGIFTPPSVQGSVHVPGSIGGMHWGGAAWDPVNRLIIAPVNRRPMVIRLIPAEDFVKERRAHPTTEVTEQKGAPFSMSREFFNAPSGNPCTAPPWGELVAVSPDTGKIEWHVPLGEIQAKGISVAGLPNLGGPATTTTGLAFIAASIDPHIRAFDTATGRLLWTGELPTAGRATPLIFTNITGTNASGRQMVAIAAGGFDDPVSKLDTKLVVFALPANVGK